jgi:antitoxin PrlF
MEQVIVRVTRKGQVTIPAEFRKTHQIFEGSRVSFREQKGELILEPIPSIEDLAGIDAGKISYKEATKKLDGIRGNDRY